MSRTILLMALMAAGVAQAQPGPPRAGEGPGRAGPSAGAGVLSPEALATIPDLAAAQQAEVRRILLQRRDAHDAVRTKERSEREALAARSRTEHERIDDESSARLRKLLGDDGYRTLAQWLLPQRPGAGPGRPGAPHGHAPVAGLPGPAMQGP